MTDSVFLRATDPDTLSGHVRNLKPPLLLSQARKSVGTESSVLIDNSILRGTAEELSEKINEAKPEKLVIEFSSSDSDFVERLVKMIERSETIIGVGQHPSFSYQILGSLGFDYAVRGEYDSVMPLLFEAVNNSGPLPEGVYDCESGEGGEEVVKTHTDQIPSPDFDLVAKKHYQNSYPVPGQINPNWGFVMSTRGCPHKCSFCSYSIRHSFGKGHRMKDPEKVVDEVEGLKEQGVTVIDFIDDDLTISSEHVRSLCREMISRNVDIPWVTHARIDEVDRELLELMKEAGCYMLRFGIESGSPKILNTLNKTPYPENWKKEALRIFDICDEIGIHTLGLLMIGNLGESLEDIDMTRDMVKDLKPSIIQIHYFTPFPGTQISKDIGEQKGSKYHTDGSSFSDFNQSELEILRKNIYAQHYFNPHTGLKLLKSFGTGLIPLFKSTAKRKIGDI